MKNSSIVARWFIYKGHHIIDRYYMYPAKLSLLWKMHNLVLFKCREHWHPVHCIPVAMTTDTPSNDDQFRGNHESQNEDHLISNPSVKLKDHETPNGEPVISELSFYKRLLNEETFRQKFVTFLCLNYSFLMLVSVYCQRSTFLVSYRKHIIHTGLFNRKSAPKKLDQIFLRTNVKDLGFR